MIGGNHLTGDIPTKLGEMKGLVDLLLSKFRKYILDRID